MDAIWKLGKQPVKVGEFPTVPSKSNQLFRPCELLDGERDPFIFYRVLQNCRKKNRFLNVCKLCRYPIIKNPHCGVAVAALAQQLPGRLLGKSVQRFKDCGF